MEIANPYRRPALKLIARARRLGKREVEIGSRAAVLTAVGAVIAAAWLVIAVNRVGIAVANEGVGPAAVSSRQPAQATPVNHGTNRATTLSKRDAMVYLVAGDDAHSHAPVHAPDASRQAVSLSLAKSRGLVPCGVCFRGK